MKLREKDEGTQERILQAAREVFQERGMEGARMQEIADRAGINKALLHYYFGSKEELFHTIFSGIMSGFIAQISSEMNAEKPIEVKVWAFVENYINKFLQVPHIPLFVITEMNRNPAFLASFMQTNLKVDFSAFQKQLDEAAAKGEIRPITVLHLYLSMLGMCIFPFVARPIIQTIFQLDDATYRQEIELRKKIISEMVMAYLRSPK